MTNFDTKIKLSTISLGHSTQQEYVLEYSADQFIRSLDSVINYDKNVGIPAMVPIIFHNSGIGYALRESADSSLKPHPAELSVIYDTDKKKPLLWISSKKPLVIKPSELSKNAVINYDKKGNLEMITDEAIIRVTLKPKSARKKIEQEYGEILNYK